jgi:hypothetical protein
VPESTYHRNNVHKSVADNRVGNDEIERFEAACSVYTDAFLVETV